eukprot:11695-Chlamydomonas_euryale.AAC.1
MTAGSDLTSFNPHLHPWRFPTLLKLILLSPANHWGVPTAGLFLTGNASTLRRCSRLAMIMPVVVRPRPICADARVWGVETRVCEAWRRIEWVETH